MKKRILTFCCVLLVLSLIQNLLGCAGGSHGIDKTNNSALVISTAGTIPVIKNSATTTKLFVYNNSDKTITDINYKVSGNQLESTNYMVLGSECKSIIAHSSCALTITTPWLNDKEHSGSSMIFAYYDSTVSKQLINYRVVSDGEIAYSDKSLPISKEMTVYAYNSTDKEVIVESLSYSGVKLVNNAEFSIGETLPAGKVIAMALESESMQSASYIALSTEAKNKQTYTSRLELLSQTRSDQDAVLVAGNVPVYNTYGSSVNGMVTIQNVGQSDARNISITSESSKLRITNNTCGTNLASTGSCIIYFTINDDSLRSSADISIGYSGGVSGYSPLTVRVNYYNQQQTPLISANASSILSVVSQSIVTSITINNTGSYNVTNLIATYVPATNAISITPISIVCQGSSGNTLLANSMNACNLVFSLLTTTQLNSTLKIRISGSYSSSQNYSRSLLVPVVSGGVIVNGGSIDATVGVNESTIATITNNSNTTYSNVSVISMTSNSANVTILESSPTITCSGTGNILPPGGNCSFLVKVNDSAVENAYIYSSITLQDSTGTTYQTTGQTYISTTMYAYIANWGSDSITTCAVNSDGTFSNCSNSNNSLLGVNLLDPEQIYMHQGYLYISGGSSPGGVITNSVVCPVNFSQYLSNCQNVSILSGLNTWPGSTHVIDINGNVFIATWSGQGVYYCTNNPISSPWLFSSCRLLYPSIGRITQFAVGNNGNSSNNFYFEGLTTNAVYQVKLLANGRPPATVTSTTANICPSAYSVPRALAISQSGNNLYVTCVNSSSNSGIIQICPILANGSISGGCTTIIQSGSSDNPNGAQPNSLTVNNNLLYVSFRYKNTIGAYNISSESNPVFSFTSNVFGLLSQPFGIFFRNGAALN